MPTSLNIPFTEFDEGDINDPDERRFVHLEQLRSSANPHRTVTMFDIYQMVARARSGISAQTYGWEACPVTFINNVFTTWFHFYAWPSRVDLPHAIGSSIGYISKPTLVEVATEFEIVFEMERAVELDFILKDILSVSWETPCYDVNGVVVPDVELEMDGFSTVVASEEIFGVARIRGRKVGARHKLTVNLTTGVPTNDTTPGAGDGSYELYINGYTGNYNFTDYTPRLGGTLVPQIWTITHVTSEVFNVSGNTIGALPAGNINEDYNCQYFTIKKDFFSGSYTPGLYLNFTIKLKEGVADNWGYTDIITWTDPYGNNRSVPQDGLNMTGATLTNLNPTVTAHWIGRDGKEKTDSLRLGIQKCVQDLLSMCDPFGDHDGDGIPNYSDPDYGRFAIFNLNPAKYYKLYYSICDGDVLRIDEVDRGL